MLRKTLLIAAVAVVALSVATSGYALQKQKARTQLTEQDAREPGPWGASDYCTLMYYNLCGPWIYTWSGWSASDVVGTQFNPEDCGPKPQECATLQKAIGYWRYTAPTYGAVAAMHCYKLGNEPEGHLGKGTFWGEPFEPLERWNEVDLQNCHVGGGGIIAYHWVTTSQLRVASSAVALHCLPGGLFGYCTYCPCVTCPAPGESFYYGQIGTGNFSGSYLFHTGNYGNTTSEDWLVDIVVSCFGPTEVTPSTWGSIKAMYE